MSLRKIDTEARTFDECVKTNEIATNSNEQIKKIEQKSNSDDLHLSALNLSPDEQYDLSALETALPNYPLRSIKKKERITRLSAILQAAAIYVEHMDDLRDTKNDKLEDLRNKVAELRGCKARAKEVLEEDESSEDSD